MTTATKPITHPTSAARFPIYHVFLPYALTESEFPPPGAVALCGFVCPTNSERREIHGTNHRDVCVVCSSMAEELAL